MAIVVKDRVKVTSTTTGTGTLTLGSAESGFQAFSAVGDGNQTYYAIKDGNGTGWEVGIGTYTASGTTLSRDTILESSNSGSAITLTSNTHTVFTTYPAERSTFSDQGIAKEYTATGSITAGKPVILKADGTAEQVVKETTTNDYDPQDATSEVTSPNGANWYTSNAQYNSTQGVLLFGNSSNSTYYPMITPATANADGSVNLGTSTIVESTTTYGGFVTTNTQANEFLCTWNWAGTTSGIRMKAGTIGGTSTAPTVTLGSMVQVDTKVGYYHHTCYDSNVDRYVAMLQLDNTGGQTQGQVYAYNISVSGTTPSVNNSGGTRLFTSYDSVGGSSTGGATQCAFDPSANRVFIKANGLSSDGSTFKVMTQVIELTTTAINGASNTPVILDSALSASSGHAQSENDGSMVYNPDTSKMLVAYILRGASDTLTRGKLKIATIGSTSATFGAVTTIDSNPCNNVITGYDENLNKFSVIRNSSSFTPQSSSFYNMTVDGSDNITMSSEVVLDASAYLGINNNYGAILAYDPTVYASYAGLASSSNYYIYSFQSKNETTTINLDSTNYLGVASTSASTTEKVNINLPNMSINNSQSGLTVGDDYFCDTSGNIKKFMTSSTSTDTSPTVKALTTMDDSDTSTDKVASTYEATSGTYVMVYRDTSNSNYGTLVAGTWADGTITWGTPYVVGSYAVDSSGLDITAGDGYVALQIYRVAVSTYMKVYSISGTTFTNTESQTIWNGSPVATSGNKVTWIPSSSLSLTDGGVACGVVFCIYSHDDGGTDKTFGRAFAIKSTTGAETGKSAEASFLNTNAHMQRANLVTDPDNAKAIYSTYDSTDSDVGKSFVFGIGGTGSSPTHTVGTEVDFSGSDDAPVVTSVYDPDNDKVVIVWRNLSGGTYTLKGCIGTIDAGTNAITYSADTTLISTGMNYISEFDITYDEDSNKIIFYYNDGNNSDAFTYKIITSTGSALSIADGAVISTNNCKLQTDSASSGAGKGTMCAVQDNSNSNYVSYTTAYYGTSTTYTKTDAQYIGKALSATALELKETPTDIIFGKASNTIAKGNTVLVEADGDFAKVTGSTTSISEITPAQVHNIQTGNTGDKFGMASDGAGLVCAIWQGSSSYAYVAKAIINDNNSLYWGTPVVMTSDASTFCSAYYDKTNAFFVVQYSHGNYWNAFRVKGTGSTSTVTNVGSSSTSSYGLGSGVSQGVSIYDETESCGVTFLGKATSKLGMLTSNQAQTSADGGTGLGYRGVSSQLGSAGSSCQFIGMDFDQTNNVGCMWYRDEDNGDYPTVRAFTVNGSTTYGDVVLGTAVVLISNGTNAYGGIACGSPDSSEWVTVWKDTSTELWYSTLTLDGTSITSTTALQMDRDGTEEYYVEGTQILTYNPKSKKYYFAYNNSADNYDVMLKELSYDNGALTVDSTIKVVDASSSYTNNYYWNVKWVGNTAREAQEGYMLLLGKYGNPTNSTGTTYYGPAWTNTETNLTAENFIGFADTASSANETSKVKIIGLDVNQSGLTAGQKLYVQNDGTLSETAVTGLVVDAGQAISSTKIKIKG